jgi:hypothetical protein
VHGEPASLEVFHPADAAASRLDHFRGQGAKVTSSRIADAQLGELKAARLVPTYTRPGSPQEYVVASVLEISGETRFLYELTLYSRPGPFERDKTVLDALVRSWKALKVQ